MFDKLGPTHLDSYILTCYSTLLTHLPILSPPRAYALCNSLTSANTITLASHFSTHQEDFHHLKPHLQINMLLVWKEGCGCQHKISMHNHQSMIFVSRVLLMAQDVSAPLVGPTLVTTRSYFSIFRQG